MATKLKVLGGSTLNVTAEGLVMLEDVCDGTFSGSGPHAASHQNGGADEVSVAGLSGVLADPQTVTKAEIEARLTGVIASHSHAGGDGGTLGTGTLNFGARTAARSYAEVDVTGLTGLTGASHLEAFLQGDATADHSADEHLIEVVNLRAKYLSASSMRVVGQVARGRAWGDFTFHYRIS